MTDLRRYTAGDMQAAAGKLQSRFAAGLLDPLDVALRLAEFRLRDERGDYWFLDARTSDWYRFDGRQWQASTTEPQVLEGPASLAVAGPVPADEEALARELDAEEDPVEAAPTEVLVSIVQDVRAAYEAGHISSTDVEHLLGGQYLVDSEGAFWMVGLRSGTWYTFADAAWSTSQGPPPVESLAQLEIPQVCEACGHAVEGEAFCPQCGTQVLPTLSGLSDEGYVAMLNFVTFAMGSLPEPVTDAWEPPSDFPDTSLECASCRWKNAAGSRFCSRCAAPLVCTQCGTRVMPGRGLKFCTQCAAPLS